MMEPEMTKTKNQTLISLKSFILGIVAFLIVAMSLFQVPFERYSDEYVIHKKKYAKIIKSRNRIQDSLLVELGKTLSIEEYKKERLLAWSASKLKLDEYGAKKKQLANEHSFLGRANFKFWLFQFGLILLGFYFSVKSLINDLRSKIKTGHEVISVLGISVCLFWFYHLFFKTAADFYTETYLIFKFILALGAGYFVSRLIKYFVIQERVVDALVKLIVRIKKIHYANMVIKALYAEKHDKSMDSIETVKTQAAAFDNDVKQTIEKFI